MSTIELRAFNLRPGAAILIDGTPTVVTHVYRDADREVVTAYFRPLEAEVAATAEVWGGPAIFRFDYCEPVELVGLVVNEDDLDDDDHGV